jgi:hypothetical protein
MMPELAEPPAEVTAFLNALDSSLPEAPTACPARTVRLLGAHMAGNYREITRHLEAYLTGSQVTRTRTFDDREPEFRELSCHGSAGELSRLQWLLSGY